MTRTVPPGRHLLNLAAESLVTLDGQTVVPIEALDRARLELHPDNDPQPPAHAGFFFDDRISVFVAGIVVGGVVMAVALAVVR